MRCYMGSSDDRLGPLPIEAHMETTIKLFRSVQSRRPWTWASRSRWKTIRAIMQAQ